MRLNENGSDPFEEGGKGTLEWPEEAATWRRERASSFLRESDLESDWGDKDSKIEESPSSAALNRSFSCVFSSLFSLSSSIFISMDFTLIWTFTKKQSLLFWFVLSIKVFLCMCVTLKYFAGSKIINKIKIKRKIKIFINSKTK